MRRLVRRVAIAASATIALTWCSSSWGWGPNGHAMIADVAINILSDPATGSPATLAQVQSLLPEAMKLDPATLPATQLADIASVPDAYRANNHPETAQWHFVDIPLRASSYDETRDCHYPTKKGDPPTADLTCIVAKLAYFTGVLADHSQTAAARGQALAFVVHFVGDIHQPLHAEDNNGDGGGNGLRLAWRGENTNLHFIWDSNLIDDRWALPVPAPNNDPNKNYKVDLGPAGAAAKRFDPVVCPDKPNEWVRSGVTQDMHAAAAMWANQSHALAPAVYQQLPTQFSPGWEDSYATYANPIIECQLQRAGTRLAEVLREALP